VLVWPGHGRPCAWAVARSPRFVSAYADLASTLSDAAKAYAEDVRGGSFNGPDAHLLAIFQNARGPARIHHDGSR